MKTKNKQQKGQHIHNNKGKTNKYLEKLLQILYIAGIIKSHLDNNPPGCSYKLPGGMVRPILRFKVSWVAVAEVTEAEAGWDISHEP